MGRGVVDGQDGGRGVAAAIIFHALRKDKNDRFLHILNAGEVTIGWSSGRQGNQ